jgi:L-alanine-DL-glutamate epimerase-like enolase superfamily enzyme
VKLKITDVEVIPIYPRLAHRYEARKVDLYGIDARTLFRVRTDCGLVGYGDQRVRPWAQPAPDCAKHLIGRSAFEFLNCSLHLGSGLSCALYDVMGKFLEAPVHRLLGQQVRDRIQVAAWTRPASPTQFAAEIRRAAAEGYQVFKMHTCDYHDVFAQTRLAEEAAPPGFRLHYDFNGNRAMGTVLPIIKELARHPIVGWIEDPLVRGDLDGWRRLRRQVDVPLIMHGMQLGGVQEVIMGLADIYMVSGDIGDIMAQGMILAKANLQALLQFEGGTLGKAMAMHLASVLPSHTVHSINLDDQYAEDVTTSRIPVLAGASPVPTGPGLGVEVDEAAVERLSRQQLIEAPRHVGVLRLADGQVYYGRSWVSPASLTGTQEGATRGHSAEIWEDDGSTEFGRVWDRVQREGTLRAE